MLILSTIKLTQPLLGNIQTSSGLRAFSLLNKDPKEQVKLIEINTQYWLAIFLQAGKELGLNLKKENFIFSTVMEFDGNFEVETRTFNKTNVETFEAVGRGSELTIKFLYKDPEISRVALVNLLRHVGNFYGISPWGSKFGYGRFIVLDSDPSMLEKHDEVLDDASAE